MGSSLTQNSGCVDELRNNVSVVDLADPANPKLRGSLDFPDERGPNGLEFLPCLVQWFNLRTDHAVFPTRRRADG